MTFKVLSLLRRLLDGVLDALSPTALVGFRPTIHFRPELETCPFCGERLKVKKTSIDRLAHTLHIGGFLVRETSLGCGSCDDRRIYRSEELGRIFPEKCNFGYDVIVYVGRRLFLDNRTVGEVKTELAAKNVAISESEVDFLGKKFVAYLTAAHRRTASRLREAMARNGGYMLHVDATCEGGGPMLLSGMDAITSTILWNRKIPTEKANHVVPFLKEIKELYGPPLLMVMDMSKGFENAAREAFGKNTRILICHFHFLRDVGKDLLGKDYDMVRKRLRKHRASPRLRYRIRPFQAVVDENPETLAKLDPKSVAELTDAERKIMPTLAAYSLVQWALEGKKVGDAYGFPFDRPLMSFALRVEEALRQIEELKKVFANNERKHNKPLFKTAVDMRRIIEDKPLRGALDGLKDKVNVFDKLRKAMRIAPRGGGDGLNDDGGDEPIEKIESRVADFRKAALKNRKMKNVDEYKKMIEQIDKYWSGLFADPVKIDTPNGTISIQPQRTNNIMEKFFRSVRQGHRRRTGNDSMKAKLKAMKANTVLVKNLENKQYMDMLLNGKNSLEEVFAEIDVEEVRAEMTRDSDDEERVPAQVRRMIKQENFPSEMVKSLKKMVR